MEITVNNQSQTVGATSTLSKLIEQMGLDAKRIAIEYNGEILCREQFDAIVLQQGDKVEIVNLVGGG